MGLAAKQPALTRLSVVAERQGQISEKSHVAVPQ